MKKLLSLILAVMVFLTVFTACQNEEIQTETQTVVRTTMSSEPDSLHPWKSAASDTDAIFHNVFEGLFLYDENGNITPGIAKDYSVSEDGLEYTFYLRDDVVFHNGKKLSSEDVVYSYNNFVGLDGYEAVTSRFSNVVKVEAIDDYTVLIAIDAPSAAFLQNNILAILPLGYEEHETAPIGTGPYKFKEYTPGQRVVLELNENYYDETKKGSIQECEVYIMSDESSIITALKSNQLDFASISADNVAVLEDEFNIISSPQNLVQLFAFNHEIEPLGDILVRQAINHAINKQEIIDVAFGGYATILDTNFSPVMDFYYNDTLENYYAYDVDKAKELMEQAGYEDGFSLTLTVPSNYTVHVDTAQVIQQQLKEINIDITIEPVDWNTWLVDVYQNANYESTVVGLTGKLDPDAILIRYESEYLRNFYNFSNERFDELINSAKYELDEEERSKMYKECQEILTREAAAVYISDPNLTVAIRSDLQGYTFYPVTFIDFTKLYYQ